MLKAVIIFMILFHSAAALSASTMYYPVPIKMDLPPVPTELYLKVITDPIGLPYNEFKVGKLTGSDRLFVDTMEALLRGKASTAKKFIKLKSGLETEEEVGAYLNKFRDLYKGMTNLTVISKIYYSTGYAYLWAVDIKGRKIATSLYFEKDENGTEKYLDLESIPLVNKLVKDAVVKSYYLPDTYRQRSDANLEYEVELENESQAPLGVYLGFNAKQVNVHLSGGKSGNSESGVNRNNKIAQFYSNFKEQLDKPNIAAVFSKLSKKSNKRLGGAPTPENEAEVIRFVANILVPSSIVKVIEIAPFKMVVGTHFTDQYLAALELSNAERNEALSKIPFIYSYLVESGADFQFVNVRRYGLLDQVLIRNDFFSKRLIPQILSKK